MPTSRHRPDRRLTRATLAAALVAACAAHAAATDCIKEGGQMLCTDPVLKSEGVRMCSETGAFTWISMLEGSCGFGSATIGNVDGPNVCFQDGMAGCPGSTPINSGWSSAGQVYGSWNCWTITTKNRNGYLVDRFAVLNGAVKRKDGNNQCTVPGTGVQVVAWWYRDVSCPAGWSQTTIPGTDDYRCYRCPDHSTWTGSACACDTGYVKDLHTMECIPGCQKDADCDDKDFCNGIERCSGGSCTKGPKDVCDDGKVCTMDVCDPKKASCTNTVDKLKCSCFPLSLPEIKQTAKTSFSVGRLACPVIGGDATAEMELSGEISAQAASCDNGCVAKGGGTGEAKVSGAVCSVGGDFTAKGKFEQENTYTLECSAADCKLGCGNGACVKTTAGGSVSVGREEKFKGFQKDFKGPAGVEIKCGGKYAWELTTDIEWSGTDDKGYGQGCADCNTLKASLSGEGSASYGCKFTAPGNLNPSGCLGCASVKATETGGSEGKWGACGTESCPSVKVDVEGALKAKVELKYMFVTVGGECSGKVTACSEANACGTCSCKGCQDADWKFTCKVTTPFDFSPGGGKK